MPAWIESPHRCVAPSIVECNLLVCAFMKKCIFHRHSRRGAVLHEKIPICIHRLYSRWSLTIEQVWAKKRRLLGIPIFQMCSDPRMRARGPLWNNLSSLRLAHRRSAPWFQRPPPHVDNIFQAKLADQQLFLTEQLSATNSRPVLLSLKINGRHGELPQRRVYRL